MTSRIGLMGSDLILHVIRSGYHILKDLSGKYLSLQFIGVYPYKISNLYNVY